MIALGLIAIRERDWEPVLWLTVAEPPCTRRLRRQGPHLIDSRWLATHAPVIFAFACAAAALFFARDRLRSKLALAFLVLACVATFGYSITRERRSGRVASSGPAPRTS